MSDTEDIGYQAPPSLSEWRAGELDFAEWDAAVATLDELRRELDPEALASACRVVVRSAAIDTGAIEGLYRVSRGFTFTIAQELAAWERDLATLGKQSADLVGDQLATYEALVDLVTGNQPVAEAWIRDVHAQLLAHQPTHASGRRGERELHRGAYKERPNNVTLPDGSVFHFASVLDTPIEMASFAQVLADAELAALHPSLQAAYAHYTLVRIHPFADGNGRVARALASVFLLRAVSVPFLVFDSDRGAYFQALRSADAGDLTSFARFVVDRTVGAIRLVAAQFGAPGTPAPSLMDLYVTPGGRTHEEIDHLAQQLRDRLLDALRAASSERADEYVSARAGSTRESGRAKLEGYRPPRTFRDATLFVELKSAEPWDEMVTPKLEILVPRDGTLPYRFIPHHSRDPAVEATAAEIEQDSGAYLARLRLAADRVVDRAVAALAAKISARQDREGY